ncbi:MAG: LysM peptidoglycan-binding domain-containing protein [Deltaproteobacteria bacterium]|nr:LysM peptidoglycan-binding domain-containing protein [Deltaproteobacteria bacterium]
MKDEKNINIDFSKIEEDLKYDKPTGLDERVRRRRVNFPFKLTGKKILWVAGAVVVIVFLFALFYGGDSESNGTDLSGIQASLEKLTTKVEENYDHILKDLGTLKDKIDHLQRRVDDLAVKVGSTGAVGKEPVRQSTKKYHTVRRSENLSLIARKHGLTVNELCAINGITTRNPIHPGQKLRISR